MCDDIEPKRQHARRNHRLRFWCCSRCHKWCACHRVSSSHHPRWLFCGNDLSAALHQPTEASTKGAGCTAYQTLPDQIAFPQTGGLTTIGSSALALAAPITGGGNVTEQKMKLMLTYQSVNQGDSGVAFHATGEIVPRTPAVQIVGPSFVIIYKDQTTASATYG